MFGREMLGKETSIPSSSFLFHLSHKVIPPKTLSFGEHGSFKQRTKKFHIVVFPWFAFGHTNPFIQLSNKFSSHGIQVSVSSIPGNIPHIESFFNLSPPNQLIPSLSQPTYYAVFLFYQYKLELCNQTIKCHNKHTHTHTHILLPMVLPPLYSKSLMAGRNINVYRKWIENCLVDTKK